MASSIVPGLFFEKESDRNRACLRVPTLRLHYPTSPGVNADGGRMKRVWVGRKARFRRTPKEVGAHGGETEKHTE